MKSVTLSLYIYRPRKRVAKFVRQYGKLLAEYRTLGVAVAPGILMDYRLHLFPHGSHFFSCDDMHRFGDADRPFRQSLVIRSIHSVFRQAMQVGGTQQEVGMNPRLVAPVHVAPLPSQDACRAYALQGF